MGTPNIFRSDFGRAGVFPPYKYKPSCYVTVRQGLESSKKKIRTKLVCCKFTVDLK